MFCSSGCVLLHPHHGVNIVIVIDVYCLEVCVSQPFLLHGKTKFPCKQAVVTVASGSEHSRELSQEVMHISTKNQIFLLLFLVGIIWVCLFFFCLSVGVWVFFSSKKE